MIYVTVEKHFCKTNNAQPVKKRRRVNAPSNASARAHLSSELPQSVKPLHFCPASIHPSIVARPRGPVAIGAQRRAQNTNRRMMRIRHIAMTPDDDDTYTHPRRSIDRSHDHTDGLDPYTRKPPHRTAFAFASFTSRVVFSSSSPPHIFVHPSFPRSSVLGPRGRIHTPFLCGFDACLYG